MKKDPRPIANELHIIALKIESWEYDEPSWRDKDEVVTKLRDIAYRLDEDEDGTDNEE
jgi:hypothetical protein